MIFLHKQDKEDSKEAHEKFTEFTKCKKWRAGRCADTKSSATASLRKSVVINTWRKIATKKSAKSRRVKGDIQKYVNSFRKNASLVITVCTNTRKVKRYKF